MTIAETRWRNARALATKVGGPARFAEKMEMSDSQATQIIGDNPVRNIGNKIARRIEEKFGLPNGSMDRERDEISTDTATPISMSRRAPIVGIAIGGPDGYVNIDDYQPGEGDGFVASTSTDPHAYALRMRGDSMRPRIRSGEFIVVEPSHEAFPGSDVVVKLKDGRAMVKEWLWTREGEICLGSVNNGFPPVTLPLSEIEYIHKVAAILPRDTTVFSSNKLKNTKGRKSAIEEDAETFQKLAEDAEQVLSRNAQLQKNDHR